MNKLPLLMFLIITSSLIILSYGQKSGKLNNGACRIPNPPGLVSDCNKQSCVNFCVAHNETWEDGGCIDNNTCCCQFS
ncbi:unnamed protein product [Amaranthus hypochondriacus]